MCSIKQYGDQMLCSCGQTWDTNDPNPPPCPLDSVSYAGYRRKWSAVRSCLVLIAFAASGVDFAATGERAALISTVALALAGLLLLHDATRPGR